MPSAWHRRTGPCVSVGIASAGECTGCQIEQRVSPAFYEKCFLPRESWHVSLFGCPFNDSWVSFIRTALSGDVVRRSADVLNCYPLTANVVATWARPWQMGRSGHMEKRKAKGICRVLAIAVPLGDTRRPCIHEGLIRTSVSSPSEECEKEGRNE